MSNHFAVVTLCSASFPSDLVMPQDPFIVPHERLLCWTLQKLKSVPRPTRDLIGRQKARTSTEVSVLLGSEKLAFSYGHENATYAHVWTEPLPYSSTLPEYAEKAGETGLVGGICEST